MQKKLFDRILSMLLVLVMVISTVPAAVFATEEAAQEETASVDMTQQAEDLITVDETPTETTVPVEPPEIIPPAAPEPPQVEELAPAPKPPATKATATSGTTGSCTWTLDGTVLTISGNGPMADYTGNKPWGSEITEVIIDDGVTNIGAYAFYNCRSLRSVTMGADVASIGKSAFYYCHALTAVTIGKNVKTIGSSSFHGCIRLKTVIFPEGLTTIGEAAFSACDSLSSVTIPDSVTTIEKTAFAQCVRLTKLSIGSGVKTIGDSAFVCCTYLKGVWVDEHNPYYSNDLFGVLYNKDQTVLLQAPGTLAGNYDIAEGVTTIGTGAFSGCNNLLSVTIPESVTTIGKAAFESCAGLKSVTIPNGVTTINSSAFYNCDGLTSLTIPGSLTTMGELAFSGCDGLVSVTISDGVKEISDEAFYKCTKLTSVTIPDSLTVIGNAAFAECLKLAAIELPEGMEHIGMIAFFSCRSLTSVVIPNGLTDIYTSTFEGCSGLTSVSIPASITSIERYAFSTCKALKNIYFGGYSWQWNNIEKDSYWISSNSNHELICLLDFTVYYKTETDHIFPVPYEAGLKVEPGSSFNTVNLSVPGLTAKVVSGPADVANDGKTVEVDYVSSGTITVDVYNKKNKIMTCTYTVADETNKLFAAGYGTEQRPFLIEDATQFSNIRQMPDKYYMLIDDIELGKMTPIDSFSGTLDGAEFWLKYWDYSYSANGNMGLFKVNKGTIKNLTIRDSKLLAIDGKNGSINAGMLCGTNSGIIENVVVEYCEVTADMGRADTDCGECTTHVGGICGVNSGTIRKSGARFNERITGYSASKGDDVNVNSKVGGIAGLAKDGSIFENVYSYDNNIYCYAQGETWQGGFLWLVTKGANCYANAGGIAGACDATKMSYVLGFNNLIDRTNGGKYGEALGGCLLGYSSTSAAVVMYGYSENRDGAFCGRGSVSSDSVMKKVEFLCVDIGTYTTNASNDLIRIMGEFDQTIWTTNKSIYCVDHGRYGLPEIAEFDALRVSSTKTKYDQGEALNLDAITIEAVKLNTYPSVYEPVLRGYKIEGYNPYVEGDGPVEQRVYVSWGGRNSHSQVPDYFTVTVAPHEHTWITEATCSRGKVCGTCGYISPDTTEHTFISSVVSPTCSAGGYTVLTCGACGFSRNTDPVPKLDHEQDFMGWCVHCGMRISELRDFTIYVCDAESASPVANASVTMDGVTQLTDGYGKITYQISSNEERKLVIEADGYPKYENESFILGELPDAYIYMESKNTGIYEAWCNGDNVLLIESQINNRAPSKVAKIVVKGRAKTNIEKYEIVQDGMVLASSADGTFKIKNPHFLLNAPVYARMHTDGRDGHDMFERELKIKVVGVSFDAKLDELIPHLGGATFRFDETAPSFFQGVEFPLLKELVPDDHTFKIKTDNEKLIITYGLEKDFLDKDTEDKSARELFKEILKKFKEQNDPNFWPKGKKKSEFTFTIALIIEFGADGKIKSTYGEIYIGYEFTHTWGKTFVVWIVPIYVGTKFKVGGNLTISEIGYNFEESSWLIPDAEINLYAELSVYGGLGCSLISAGVYGTAGGEIVIGWKDLQNYFKYRIYGELGIYARIDPIFWEAIEYKLPLLSDEFYGPNGQVRTKKEILTPENYDVAPRDYLETRSAWKTPSTYAKRGDISGVMQTSSYTAIEPRIVQSGDTVMMLFMDDDGSEGYNYQHLYYSILDPATNSWKTPVRVDDSQYADIEYDVYADDSGIYLAYSKVPEITEENRSNHLALLSGVEIYTARYNGSAFVDHTNVSNNDCYDSQPQVTDTAVVWISNNTNDTLGENANNTLMLARKSDNWNAVTLNQNGSTVTSIDMGMLDGKTFVALVRDTDCDLTTDDRSLQLIDLSGNVTNVVTADYTSEGVRFEIVDGKSTLQWACADNVWQLTSADQTPVALLAEGDCAINESFKYQQLGENSAVILYAKNAMDGNTAGSSIYGVYCVDGQWGQPVAITDHAEGMYVDAFDACYYKDKLLFAYINTDAVIEQESIQRTSNFVSSSIELKNDLIAEEVSFLEEELFEGAEIELRIPVTNGSWQKLQNTKVLVQTVAGSVAYEQNVKLETALASGESGLVVLKLPKECLTSGVQYNVIVNSTDWTDRDSGNNTIPLDLWYADFDVMAKQIIQGNQSQIQYAVTNKGNVSGNGKLVIYDGKNTDGTFTGRPKLHSEDITVAIGKSVTAMVPVTNAFKNKTVYVMVEPNTAEMYTFNNQQSVDVQNMEQTTTNDITGQEQAIPNPVFAEPYVIYDRYAGGDIAATATENDWTFTTIDGLDSFTYSNSVLTIPESYLKNAELGYHYYTLRYTMGDKTAEALLIVEIRDHAPLSVENVTVEYDGAPVTLSELSYETPSTGAVSTRYSTGDGWVDGLPTNAGKYTVELSLAAEENGFYTAAKQEFVLTVTKAVRSLSAPTNVKKTDKGIAFTGATPDKEPADGTITYGYSEKCDPTSVKQWSATGLITPDSTYKTYYLYARITDSSNYMDTYSAAYMLDVESLEPVAAVYINGKEKAKYTDFGKAVEACGTNGYIKLVRDAKISITLTKDLYVDLNGYDLTGTIIGGKVYGMDSTTDKYTCDNRGVFSCTDARGANVVPQTHFKSSVTGAVKRYMAISEGNGYSFHRFYLGVTHMSIKPSVTSVGFKAAFYGDEMVVNMLNENQAYGYSLGLSGYGSASAYKSRDSFESGRTVTMRIDNYDVEHFGETVLSAHVMLKLCDGTVIESADVTMTLRQLLEKLNANPSQMTADQLKVVARMIEKYPVIKSWNVSNLIQ